MGVRVYRGEDGLVADVGIGRRVIAGRREHCRNPCPKRAAGVTESPGASPEGSGGNGSSPREGGVISKRNLTSGWQRNSDEVPEVGGAIPCIVGETVL